MIVDLGPVKPSAYEAWIVLFELAGDHPDGWAVVGGQMVHLHAAEHGAAGVVRPTDDVDVIVNIRARQNGTEALASWLVAHGFQFAGANADSVGHRYTRTADPGPGEVLFDILAPDGVGERANLKTSPPARTVQVPGGTQALQRAGVVEVNVQSMPTGESAIGRVRRPSLLGAIVGKAAATTIAVRNNSDRDWQDAAMLLALIPDPFALAGDVTPGDRRRLRKLSPLQNPVHTGWALLDDDHYRRGTAALEILTAT